MVYPKVVKQCNELLKDLGSADGGNLPLYQWRWSEELIKPTVLVDDEGKIIRDMVCQCGRNIMIHSPSCTFTHLRPRWEMMRLLPQRKDQWVMCRWVAPPLESHWNESFSGELPYPREGSYIPASDKEKTICLKEGLIPTIEQTVKLIHAIREFRATKDEITRKQRERWEEESRRHYEDIRLRMRDKAPVGSGFPGQKEDFSAGGDPSIPSPTLRKFELITKG